VSEREELMGLFAGFNIEKIISTYVDHVEKQKNRDAVLLNYTPAPFLSFCLCPRVRPATILDKRRGEKKQA
jgi:hypothetical protein